MLAVKIIFIVFMSLLVLYFLAIMPNIMHRPDFRPFRGWLYAHRGLHDNGTAAPENSLAAFQEAVRAGYGIEMDIQLTKDKIPVVVHDYHLARLCKREVRVNALTLQELQEGFTLYDSEEHVPTLEEVLKIVDGKVPLIVEFKVEALNLELCPIAAKLLDAYQGTWCMESFNPLCVRWYRKNRPRVVRGQLADNFIKTKETGDGRLFWMLQNMMFNFLSRPDFIAFHHVYGNMLSLTLIKKLFRAPTFAWTIKSQEEMEKARKRFDFMIFDSFLPMS